MPTILPTKTPPTTLGQMRRHCIVVFLIGTHAPSSCYQAHCGDSPSGYWIRPPLIMSLSFAHLWQQHETSDMDVILLAPAPSGESDSDSDQHEQQADSGTPGTVELMSFPAHRTLLSNSAVLWCRVSGTGQRQRTPPAPSALVPTSWMVIRRCTALLCMPL